jgi:hypothetical protein
MALDSKNNIKSVFIVPAQAAITTGTITPGSVATGSVVVTNVSNEVLTSTTVVDYSTIKIVKDRGANLPLQQVRLNIADIIAYSGACYQPATEQVDYIGFNGTSGTIQVLPSNFYTVKLEHVPNQFAYGKRPANYKYGTYQSTIGATQNAAGQEEVATGLVKSLIQNFRPNRSTDWRVFASLVNVSTTTAAVDTDITSFSLVKYSKAVTVITAGAATITAGTYLRFGASTASTSIYKVVTGFSGGAGTYTITLDYSWQADSTTVLDTDVVSVTTGTDWGIKIVGIKQKYDVNRWRQYDKVRFNTFLEGFPNTSTPTVVTTTPAFDGVGVYEQAANDEYISWGDEGQIFVDQVPPLFREQDASPSGTYDVAILGWVNKLPSLIGAGENKGSAIFYIDNSCATQGQALLQILDAWVTNAYPTILKVYGCNGSTPGVIGACCDIECT